MQLYLMFLIICAIESSSGRDMISKKDPLCRGWTQMRPVAVRDCNRICKLRNDPRRFTNADRFDKGKSWEMFEILVTHYLGNNPTIEMVAMLWCRGCHDMKEPMTEASQHYLDKVIAEKNRRML